jgi:hypothetical protein
MNLLGFEISKIPKSINEIVIKWGDYIVLDSNYKGEVSYDSFIFDGVWETRPITAEILEEWQKDKARRLRDRILKDLGDWKGNFDIPMNELSKYISLVKNHLLNQGYIQEPRMELFWHLTEDGKLMKKLRGHKKYIKYKERQLNLLNYQRWVNGWLIAVGALSVIMPFVIYKCSRPIVVIEHHTEYQNIPSKPMSVYPNIIATPDTVKQKQ